METRDFVVIGGGIIGISMARELKKRNPSSSVLVLEKEVQCGLHASSRNSGVLHAGFYYSADSLKAKFAQAGNKALTRYCLEKSLPINRCGKLVVASTGAEVEGVEELHRRGLKNGVPVHLVDEKEAAEIEPRAKTVGKALFSPTTSTVDPMLVLNNFKEDARREGVEIREGEGYLRGNKKRLVTARGTYEAGYTVNCAGLYADRVARDFGFSRDYRILPFKGLYLYSEEPPHAFRTHIYPVPNLKNPFLGVHLTVTVDGRAKIGPTAIPAFWREQYRGMDNFRIREFLEVTFREAGLLFFSDFDFKRLAMEEITKYSRKAMVRLAARILKDVNPAHYRMWGKPGIRAQLMHVRTRKLEMDFVIEGDESSCHVLNAVSPGFTCALPFSSYVCDRIESFAAGKKESNAGVKI